MPQRHVLRETRGMQMNNLASYLYVHDFYAVYAYPKTKIQIKYSFC